MLKVDILPDNAIYHIVCQSETKLPQENMNDGIISMNNYNLKASVVSGCISSEGSIIFWLGRNIDGNTFSEQAFAVDFDMVIKETDNVTAHIFKEAHNPKS